MDGQEDKMTCISKQLDPDGGKDCSTTEIDDITYIGDSSPPKDELVCDSYLKDDLKDFISDEVVSDNVLGSSGSDHSSKKCQLNMMSDPLPNSEGLSLRHCDLMKSTALLNKEDIYNKLKLQFVDDEAFQPSSDSLDIRLGRKVLFNTGHHEKDCVSASGANQSFCGDVNKDSLMTEKANEKNSLGFSNCTHCINNKQTIQGVDSERVRHSGCSSDSIAVSKFKKGDKMSTNEQNYPYFMSLKSHSSAVKENLSLYTHLCQDKSEKIDQCSSSIEYNVETSIPLENNALFNDSDYKNTPPLISNKNDLLDCSSLQETNSKHLDLQKATIPSLSHEKCQRHFTPHEKCNSLNILPGYNLKHTALCDIDVHCPNYGVNKPLSDKLVQTTTQNYTVTEVNCNKINSKAQCTNLTSKNLHCESTVKLNSLSLKSSNTFTQKTSKKSNLSCHCFEETNLLCNDCTKNESLYNSSEENISSSESGKKTVPSMIFMEKNDHDNNLKESNMLYLNSSKAKESHEENVKCSSVSQDDKIANFDMNNLSCTKPEESKNNPLTKLTEITAPCIIAKEINASSIDAEDRISNSCISKVCVPYSNDGFEKTTTVFPKFDKIKEMPNFQQTCMKVENSEDGKPMPNFSINTTTKTSFILDRSCQRTNTKGAYSEASVLDSEKADCLNIKANSGVESLIESIDNPTKCETLLQDIKGDQYSSESDHKTREEHLPPNYLGFKTLEKSREKEASMTKTVEKHPKKDGNIKVASVTSVVHNSLNETQPFSNKLVVSINKLKDCDIFKNSLKDSSKAKEASIAKNSSTQIKEENTINALFPALPCASSVTKRSLDYSDTDKNLHTSCEQKISFKGGNDQLSNSDGQSLMHCELLKTTALSPPKPSHAIDSQIMQDMTAKLKPVFSKRGRPRLQKQTKIPIPNPFVINPGIKRRRGRPQKYFSNCETSITIPSNVNRINYSMEVPSLGMPAGDSLSPNRSNSGKEIKDDQVENLTNKESTFNVSNILGSSGEQTLASLSNEANEPTSEHQTKLTKTKFISKKKIKVIPQLSSQRNIKCNFSPLSFQGKNKTSINNSPQSINHLTSGNFGETKQDSPDNKKQTTTTILLPCLEKKRSKSFKVNENSKNIDKFAISDTIIKNTSQKNKTPPHNIILDNEASVFEMNEGFTEGRTTIQDSLPGESGTCIKSNLSSKDVATNNCSLNVNNFQGVKLSHIQARAKEKGNLEERLQRVRRRLPSKLTLRLKQEMQEQCCGHWFPNTRRFVSHLIEHSKLEKDSFHTAKLIDLGMNKCTLCEETLWLNMINMKKHLKGIHDVNKLPETNSQSNEAVPLLVVNIPKPPGILEVPISMPQNKVIQKKKVKIGPKSKCRKPISEENVERPCPKSRKKGIAPCKINTRILCDLSHDQSFSLSFLSVYSIEDLPVHYKPLISLQRYKKNPKKNPVKVKMKEKSPSPDLDDETLQSIKNKLKKIKELPEVVPLSTPEMKKQENLIPEVNVNSELKCSDSTPKLGEKEKPKMKKLNNPKSKVVSKTQQKSTSNKPIKLKKQPILEPLLTKTLDKDEKVDIPKTSFEEEDNKLVTNAKEGKCNPENILIKKSTKKRRSKYSFDPDFMQTATPLGRIRIRGRKRGRPKILKSAFLSRRTPSVSSKDDSSSDFEKDFLDDEWKENEENIPTVELDLFTLSSFNEDVSVLLVDPQNPNFKVYASMDAIFVGDSALGDVTNHLGYISDNNNVVYVNPSHFLFPKVGSSENEMPPVLTSKNSLQDLRRRVMTNEDLPKQESGPRKSIKILKRGALFCIPKHAESQLSPSIPTYKETSVTKENLVKNTGNKLNEGHCEVATSPEIKINQFVCPPLIDSISERKPPCPESLIKPPCPKSVLKPSSPEPLLKPPSPEPLLKPFSPKSSLKPTCPESLLKLPPPKSPLNPPSPESPLKPPFPESPLKPPAPESPLKPPTPESLLKPPVPESPLKPPAPESLLKPPSPESLLKPPSPESPLKPPSPESPLKPPAPESQLKPPLPEFPLKLPPPESPLKPPYPESPLKPPPPDSPLKPLPPESLLKPPPLESLLKPPPLEYPLKPSSPESSLKPPSLESSLKPPSPESSLKPPSPESSLKPSPPESPLKPPSCRSLLKPTPAESKPGEESTDKRPTKESRFNDGGFNISVSKNEFGSQKSESRIVKVSSGLPKRKMTGPAAPASSNSTNKIIIIKTSLKKENNSEKGVKMVLDSKEERTPSEEKVKAAPPIAVPLPDANIPLKAAIAKSEHKKVIKTLTVNSVSNVTPEFAKNVSYRVLADCVNPIIPGSIDCSKLDTIDVINYNPVKTSENETPSILKETKKKSQKADSLCHNYPNSIESQLPKVPILAQPKSLSPVKMSSDSCVVVASAEILPYGTLEDGVCLDEVLPVVDNVSNEQKEKLISPDLNVCQLKNVEPTLESGDVKLSSSHTESASEKSLELENESLTSYSDLESNRDSEEITESHSIGDIDDIVQGNNLWNTPLFSLTENLSDSLKINLKNIPLHPLHEAEPNNDEIFPLFEKANNDEVSNLTEKTHNEVNPSTREPNDEISPSTKKIEFTEGDLIGSSIAPRKPAKHGNIVPTKIKRSSSKSTIKKALNPFSIKKKRKRGTFELLVQPSTQNPEEQTSFVISSSFSKEVKNDSVSSLEKVPLNEQKSLESSEPPLVISHPSTSAVHPTFNPQETQSTKHRKQKKQKRKFKDITPPDRLLLSSFSKDLSISRSTSQITSDNLKMRILLKDLPMQNDVSCVKKDGFHKHKKKKKHSKKKRRERDQLELLTSPNKKKKLSVESFVSSPHHGDSSDTKETPDSFTLSFLNEVKEEIDVSDHSDINITNDNIGHISENNKEDKRLVANKHSNPKGNIKEDRQHLSEDLEPAKKLVLKQFDSFPIIPDISKTFSLDSNSRLVQEVSNEEINHRQPSDSAMDLTMMMIKVREEKGMIKSENVDVDETVISFQPLEGSTPQKSAAQSPTVDSNNFSNLENSPLESKLFNKDDTDFIFSSPQVSFSTPPQDHRSWHSRGAKLKAKIMITDHQKGICNSSVSDEKTKSHFKRKSLRHSSPKSGQNKMNTRDIRSYFSPPPKDSDSSLITSPTSFDTHLKEPPNELHSFPPSTNFSLNQSLETLVKLPRDNLSSLLTPCISPGSSTLITELPSNPLINSTRGRKQKHKLPEHMDIRCFLESTSPSSPKRRGRKRSLLYFPAEKRPRLDTIKSEPLLEDANEFTFEGFEHEVSKTVLRQQILQDYVDVLHTNTLFDTDRFPLPIDQICNWNDQMLNQILFEKG